MEKVKVVRGNKEYASKIRMYFERFCDCKSNPLKLTCDCDSYFYFVNEHGELDGKNDYEINLDAVKIINIENVLFTLGDRSVLDFATVKCDKTQSYVDYFDDILDEMSSVHEKKNADYGNNFHKRYEKYGFLTALLRLTDKMERLENIYEKGEIKVKDESVEDTLLDLANYAVMTIVELRNEKK